MVSTFAHLPYRQQRNQELLHRLSGGILTLKLDAQGQANNGDPGAPDVRATRRDVAEFLADLAPQIRAMAGAPTGAALDLAFSGVAARVARDAQGGVEDRLAQYDRLRGHLLDDTPLSLREYRALDRLQALLEEETADDMRGLFRF